MPGSPGEYEPSEPGIDLGDWILEDPVEHLRESSAELVGAVDVQEDLDDGARANADTRMEGSKGLEMKENTEKEWIEDSPA